MHAVHSGCWYYKLYWYLLQGTAAEFEFKEEIAYENYVVYGSGEWVVEGKICAHEDKLVFAV